MDDQNKNLILATALSFLVILAWFFFFPPEEPPVDATQTTETAATTVPEAAAVPGTAVDGATAAPAEAAPATDAPEAPRVAIRTPRLDGSISLRGGRIDTLSLSDYRETLDPGADTVTLLRPQGQPGAYYALFGWAQGAGLSQDDVPNAETVWRLESGAELTPETPVVLDWDNGKGQTFRRTIKVDQDYLFTVTQSVTNAGEAPVRLAPYGIIARHGEPEDLKGFFVIHEGAIRQSGSEMKEFDYGDMRDLGADSAWGPSADVIDVEANGWIGFTDHYWMTTLIPAADQSFKAALQYDENRDVYRTTSLLGTLEVQPGATAEVTQQLFAGAKEWETIRAYENNQGIYKFIDSIDWGWFFFLTKPIFWMLHTLHGMIGNMGWSIIGLTLIIKAILLPLAYKSYVSMAKMKELQPEMEKLKERAGDDRNKLQKEMMELYKKEKVNPASGCLPILLQIPIFFSLYKVIFVTIELRQEPWLGWIRDLSAPDPSSILNLFGLLPYAVPDLGPLQILSLGFFPILLGISMWLQQKLNPAPTDPTQAMIFAWMPWVFMFMLGSFASGLVIYWIANNTITFLQQYAIMASHGKRPDLFGNIFKKSKKKAAEPPAANSSKKPTPKK